MVVVGFSFNLLYKRHLVAHSSLDIQRLISLWSSKLQWGLAQIGQQVKAQKLSPFLCFHLFASFLCAGVKTIS